MTITDGLDNPTSSFKVVVKETIATPTSVLKPKMAGSLVGVLKVPIQQETPYALPVVYNTKDLHVDHTTRLPTFANFTFPEYKFSPKTKEDLGKH